MNGWKNKICIWAGPLLPVVIFFSGAFIFLTAARIGFIIWQWNRVSAVNGLWPDLGLGARMDISFLSYISAIPVLLTLISPDSGRTGQIRSKIVSGWLVFFSVFIIFMEAVSPPFVIEYDSRPNRLFIEYLLYPKEVFTTLWAAYKIEIILCCTIAGLSLWFCARLFKYFTEMEQKWPLWRGLLIAPVVLLTLFLTARSSLGHRPANIGTAAFSGDHLVNDIALSSSYSVLYALYQVRHERDAGRVYGKMKPGKIIKVIKEDMRVKPEDFTSADIPTLHTQRAAIPREHPLNLVIILEESMGARFVRSLGGRALTPELEKLSEQGLWFENMYATGTRSVRGIEAVVAGFPPTPGRSVVKLGLSGHNFFTLASLLKTYGYKSEFIYGGESHFDNMRGFFLGNGFDKVIDEKDYIHPEYTGAWGVSDEDLFAMAHKEFTAYGEQPFFAFVFTSSNHVPFDFPDDRIDLVEQPKNTLNNAVKYADFALGKFFENARKSSYWSKTVFLIVADHDIRVFGASLVPIEHFHIPALIIGPGISPRHFVPVASQMDLPTSVLSFIGISCEHPMPGRDLTSRLWQTDPGRAIMQYGNNQAYMTGNRIVILQPGHSSLQFTFTSDGKMMPATTTDPELAEKALAHALWPSLAYKQQRYHLAIR